MAGRTVDNVREMDVITYDGIRLKVGATPEGELRKILAEGGRRAEIYRGLFELRERYAARIRERFPKIPRRVSGYNLDELLPENGFHVGRALAGSEGTCVNVLEATVELVPSPAGRALVIVGFRDIYEAGDRVPEFLKCNPIGLEGVDEKLVNYMRAKGKYASTIPMLPEGRAWLFIEISGDSAEEARDAAESMLRKMQLWPHSERWGIFQDGQAKQMWQVREAGLAATARVPHGSQQKDSWPGWEDSAVHPERLGNYLRELRALFRKHGYDGALYGHFGQACVHVRIDFDLVTTGGVRKYRVFMEEATDLVLRYGGSLSGEHGDGQARAEFLPKMYGTELMEAFREFKRIWDPEGKMNPGKVVDAYRIDENLRLGTAYKPAQLKTEFQYPEDKGSFAYAALRCVGVGKCRRTEDGIMCPSFMVTREEKHSTRGRARLLFEMLQGDSLKKGMKSEAVKEALDLCLACKGCKSECPVSVDMATYKAEFLSGYYRGRLRPITAYAMGFVDKWARLGARFPHLANLISGNRWSGSALKALAGIAKERTLPRFASRTFKAWFLQRPIQNALKPRVILWPDTFNNHFQPGTAEAAVEVLEKAGFRVVVPREHLCCGRPLYDYGMLKTARRYLEKILLVLREEIRAGTPVVGLEPSCVAVFRDELLNFFPNDPDANRLSRQTYLLSEFLIRHAPGFRIPELSRKAVVQGHCHHQSVMGFGDERRVLDALGLKHEVLDSSCCGMAGSFGFEEKSDRYGVSMKVGERVLLPAVRKENPDTLIIADGFSCREQIKHGADREARHLSDVLQLSLHAASGGSEEKGSGIPEESILRRRKEELFFSGRWNGLEQLVLLSGVFVFLRALSVLKGMEPRLQFIGGIGRNRMGHNQLDREFYDVAARFREALLKDRRERGEPDEGVRRTLWATGKAMQGNRVPLLAYGAAGIALTLGLISAMRASKKTREGEEKFRAA